ncbi:50S ribosomal protein L9, partial [Paludibacteraceae bacterium OttesenSCG-928-F17]|nr:50S ribosomal protein L9 [Paludibacteraceae bacterium OttesenSCG-928-F17]
SVALAEKLKDVTLTVGAKTSSTGKIFGAVGPIQLADAFEKAGYNVDRRSIVLKEPVKEVGSYVMTLKLHKEVTVEVPFEVVSE